jgi:hypothetical protein
MMNQSGRGAQNLRLLIQLLLIQLLLIQLLLIQLLLIQILLIQVEPIQVDRIRRASSWAVLGTIWMGDNVVAMQTIALLEVSLSKDISLKTPITHVVVATLCVKVVCW